MVTLKRSIQSRATYCHAHTPVLRKLPLAALAIIDGLVLANTITWAGVGVVLVIRPSSIPTSQLTVLRSTIMGTELSVAWERCSFKNESVLFELI